MSIFQRPTSIRPRSSRSGRALLIGLVAGLNLAAGAVQAGPCFWEGKAPFCNGACSVGYTLIKRSSTGDGDKCTTGTKAYCCKTSEIIIRGTAPFCNGKCKTGEEMLGNSPVGPNGKKCTTGHAAICSVAND